MASSSTSIYTPSRQHNVMEQSACLYKQARRRKMVLTQDFYELFGFERYSSPSQSSVGKEYRKLAVLYHPDKHPVEFKTIAEAIMRNLVLARQTLSDTERKRTYDIGLRKEWGESNSWDSASRIVKVYGSGACIFGGIVLIGAEPVTGSAMFAAGFQGYISYFNDRDVSLSEFGKDLAVGAIAGVAVGCIQATFGPAARAATTLIRKVLLYAGSGALTCVLLTAVDDVAALTRGKKTVEELFCLKNAQLYAVSALLGVALAGIIGALTHPVSLVTSLTDSAVSIAEAVKTQVEFCFQNLMGQLSLSHDQALQAIQTAQSSFGLAMPVMMCDFVEDRAFVPTARRDCTKVRCAHLNDLAFKSNVISPHACLEAYTRGSPLHRSVNKALRLDDATISEYAAFIWCPKLEISTLIERGGHLHEPACPQPSFTSQWATLIGCMLGLVIGTMPM